MDCFPRIDPIPIVPASARRLARSIESPLPQRFLALFPGNYGQAPLSGEIRCPGKSGVSSSFGGNPAGEIRCQWEIRREIRCQFIILGNPVSVTMPRRGIREDENTIIRQECTHAFPGYFQSSSSFLPEKMNRHRISLRKDEPTPDFPGRSLFPMIIQPAARGQAPPDGMASSRSAGPFRARQIAIRPPERCA
jgi:hypothetical protein